MVYQQGQAILVKQIISRVLGIMGLVGISACGVRVNWVIVGPSIRDGCSLCFVLTKPLSW